MFGNHDTDQMSKEQYVEHISNSAVSPASSYYSFDRQGVHFVVLDASFKSDGSAYSEVPNTPGAGYKWSDANVPQAELDWLKADLAASKGPVIVFAHQYLNPAEQVDAQFDPVHAVRNAEAIRKMLEQSGKVLAVFAGHYHDGDFQSINGIAYVGLQASAAYGNDTAYHNQYAVVDVLREGPAYRVLVQGHGRYAQPSFRSPLPGHYPLWVPTTRCSPRPARSLRRYRRSCLRCWSTSWRRAVRRTPLQSAARKRRLWPGPPPNEPAGRFVASV